MRGVMMLFLWAAAAVAAPESHGPWSVRRGRSTDATTAGGYPTWSVTFSAPQESPDVLVAGDEAGPARGSILIGRRVKLAGEAVSLDFSFTTRCAMAARSGRWELVILTPEAWDALGQEPTTEVVFNRDDRRQCLAAITVKELVGDDVETATPLPDEARQAMAALTGRMGGREVVIAAAWTALHGNPEQASLHGLKLATVTREEPAAALFRRLDLGRPGLEAVRAAIEREQTDAALAALARYYRERREPPLPVDLRATPNKISAARQAEADGALENRFVGQPSYGLQQVPGDIDWSFNPGQDPEWTWQFNRHGAWLALAQAYLASGDEKYAARWVELLRDWVAENPPGTPWSWRTIEAGIRPAVWLQAFFAFSGSPHFTPADQALLLASLAAHAEYLMPERRFSSGSNWGIIESTGLLQLGSFLPEFREATSWRDTAWGRIEAEMFRQVLPDGSQVELTTSYHFGVLSDFKRAAQIAEQGGTTVKPEFLERLERMYDYALCLIKPDGTVPMLGDSWPSNIRGTLVEGGRRFGRDDLLHVGTAGKEGAPPASLDTLLPDAGYHVFRTAWDDPQAVWLLTDVAHRWGGGHQHPDALQVILYAYGQTLNPDTGSYLYYGPGRAAASRTSAHSTVTVDEANQGQQPAVTNASGSTPTLSFVDGQHPGYPNVVHRRQVLFARPVGAAPAYVVVVDRLTGQGSHTLDQTWHFRPGTMAMDSANLSARTTNPGPNLLVQSLRREGIGLEAIESFVSLAYTRKEERPAVRFRQQTALPARFVTLLLPYRESDPPKIEATLVADTADLVEVSVSGPGFRDRLLAAAESMEMPGIGRALAARVHSDGAGARLSCDLVAP